MIPHEYKDPKACPIMQLCENTLPTLWEQWEPRDPIPVSQPATSPVTPRLDLLSPLILTCKMYPNPNL